ncbi:MAG: NHL repeat-containing protein [Gemmataceae bacterium]
MGLLTRRGIWWLGGLGVLALGLLLVRPWENRGPRLLPDKVWGKRGVMPGDLVRPRAVAIDPQDRLYLVDFTARVQAYDLDGNHLGVSFTTPDFRNGRPSGLSIDREGHLIVCDSHYHCVRIYNGTTAQEIRVLGGEWGTNPGQFGYVSDCVQDAEGYYYISEFGSTDRITKLDSEGRFVQTWGTNGIEPGQFQRIRSLAFGPDGLLYVVDACNHRVQVFSTDGTLIRMIGGAGQAPGQMSYPYDIAFSPQGDFYVSERGNQRIQKFRTNGESLGVWGSAGRKPGQLADPWAIAVDRHGQVHVVDTENHRVQRLRF